MGKKSSVKMTVIARPRDCNVSDRPPNERTLESYKRNCEWVVEAIDEFGRWVFTHYGPEPMTRRQAVKLAQNWFPE